MPAALFMFIVLIAGCLVWGLILRRMAAGLPALDPVPKVEPRWGMAAVVTVVLFIAFQLVTRLMSELALLNSPEEAGGFSVQAAQATIVINALLVGLVLFFLTDAGQRNVREFGIHTDTPADDVRIAAAGFLASTPLVMLVMLATMSLRTEERTHSMVRLLTETPTFEIYLWVAITALIAAPLAEELVFRVVLQGWLRTKMSAGGAIAISSVAFCAVHGFPDSLALLPLAFILGYVFEQRRSYLAVVLLHALFNTQPIITMLLQMLGPPAEQ